MTEKEVRIINGKEVVLYRHKELDSYLFLEDAVDLLLKAFEEVEQYRAIGTVEEFKALKEGGRFLEFLYNHIPPNEMEQYLSMYQAKDKVAVNGYADQCGLMPAT